MTIVVGQQNTLTYTFTVVAGVATLVITGETAWDLGFTDIVRITNTTHAGTFYLDPSSTFSNTFVSGLPTYTWTFSNYPTGSATSDTLLIYLNVNPQQAEVALLQYQKA